MSLTRWLEQLRRSQSPAANQDGRRKRFRPHVETLEQRLNLHLTAPINIPVDVTARHVATADLNRDGHLDFVSANTSNLMNVLLGNGDGTFQDRQQIHHPFHGFEFVELADLNGDTWLDIITANSNSGSSVTVLRGNGDGTFQGPMSFATSGTFPIQLVLGDFTNDTRVDVVTLNLSSQNLSLLAGNGDGTFQTGQTFGAVSPQPSVITTSDFNSDGNLDLAVSYFTTARVGIFLGNGTGTFQPPLFRATGPNPIQVIAADLNGDTRPDLIVGNSDTNISIFRGNGDGTFLAPANYNVGLSPRSLVAADVNEDSLLDIVFAGSVNNIGRGGVLLAAGGGGTLQVPTFGIGVAVLTNIRLGDFNTDGKLDLLLGQENGSFATLLLGDGDGSFQYPIRFAADPFPRALANGDFNGDGFPDLVAVGTSVSVLRGNGNGLLQPPLSSFPSATTYLSVAVADVNGDTILDLVTASLNSTSISVFRGNGDGTFQAPVFHTGFLRPELVIVGDFNRDGSPDIGTANFISSLSANSESSLSVFLNNGSGSFGAPSAFDMLSGPPRSTTIQIRSLESGDFNRDGNLDLVALNFNTARVFLGNGDGSFQPAIPRSVSAQETFGLAVGDLNADNIPDLAITHLFNELVSIYLGNGDGTFSAGVNYGAGYIPQAVAIADLTDDGVPDVVVANRHRGISVVPGNGNGTLRRPVSYSVLAAQEVPLLVSDLNRDSRPDVVVATSALGGRASVVLNPGQPLRVTSFTPTSSGFTIQFNRALETFPLNLYDTEAGTLGPADVVLTGPGGPVRGSLVVEASSTRITFVATSGPMTMGNYIVTLRSAANGFRTPNGVLLDGNGDGTLGDDYTNTFTIASSTAPIVSVPDFARGPGQAVNVPASAANGIPLRLSEGNGVTSVNLTLLYNPALLTITAASQGPGTPPTATVTLNTSTPGQAVITFTSPALGMGAIDFVTLTASVPSDASYASKHVLDITSLTVNGALARDDDGIHVVGYLGDTTGNGTLSTGDATRALRGAVGLDSGFSAYQLADPVILADINESGAVNATDATRILQEAIGIDRPEIPALPALPPPIVLGGPDPLLSLPKRLRGRPGSVLVVPVNLDPSEGLESADLALSFDTSRLEVVSVGRGKLTHDFDLFAVNLDLEAGTIRIGLGRSAGPITGRGRGSVLLITFRIKPDAAAGRTILNLRQEGGATFTQLNEGGLDLIPDPSNVAGDVLDGELTIRGRAVRQRLARDRAFAAGPESNLGVRSDLFSELARKRRQR